MDGLESFKKLLFTAAICAVSCVGRADRERIVISDGAMVKVRQEVKELLTKWRHSNGSVDRFYKNNAAALVRDYDILLSILTKDCLECLALCPMNEFLLSDTFEKFEEQKFWGYKGECERWKFVRDILYYKFNPVVHDWKQKRVQAQYVLEIFNHAVAMDRRHSLHREFFGGKGESGIERHISGWKDSLSNILKILWEDVRRGFKETSSGDLTLVRLANFVNEFGNFETACKILDAHSLPEGSSGTDEKSEITPCRILCLKDCGLGKFNSMMINSKAELELLREGTESSRIISYLTREKILSEIREYLLKKNDLEGTILRTGCSRRIPFVEEDSVVLFRFFTQKIAGDFLCPEKFKKLSPKKQREFIQKRKDKSRFSEYVTEGVRKTFGFYRAQAFRQKADWEGCCSKFITERGFELNYLNFMVTRLTLFGHSGDFSKTNRRYELKFEKAFESSFLKAIADLLYQAL